MKFPTKDFFLSLANIFLFAATFLIFFLIGCLATSGGYDEIGAVVSHLELQDNRFVEEYIKIFESFGIPDFLISNFFIPLLKIFIVPIRWTYAIGISPIYGLARLDFLSWNEVRLIFVIIHSFINVFSLFLISKILSSSNQFNNISFKIILFTLCIASYPFLYWSMSLTSYSMHLLSISVLLYSEHIRINKPNNYFSRGLYLSLPIFLNYQYLPIVFALGIRDLVFERLNFFKVRVFTVWILPFIASLISILFIIQRLFFINASEQPQFNFENSDSFLIPYGETNLIELISFFWLKLIDIFSYLFQFRITENTFINTGSIENINYISILIFLLSIFIIFSFKNLQSKQSYIYILLLICLIQVFGYLFNILPMSPTRHSLLIFIPLVILLSLSVWDFSLKFPLSKIVPVFFSLFLIILHFRTDDIIKYEKFETDKYLDSNCLDELEIEQVLIDDCSFLPILQNKEKSSIFSKK